MRLPQYLSRSTRYAGGFVTLAANKEIKTIEILILLISTSFNQTINRRVMGMDYSIYADRDTKCEDDFPEGLSFFFEQYGGYVEYSEVGQVSALLKINLSGFQHYDYGADDEQEEKQYWQDIGAFRAKVSEFIHKIEQKPDYYKAVKHGQHPSASWKQMVQAMQEGDEAIYNEVATSEANLYPPDYEYLSSGSLKKDLLRLKGILECFKKAGVQKIKLMYS
jgi:hypothetical protein